MSTITELQQKDLQFNWHPYSQHQTMGVPIVITRGKDALLWDENGKEYIDAIASWWVNPHGHCNTYINDAIYQQINTLEHVLFGGFTHPAVIELSEKLLNILPSNQKKIFYSDNGSTAVEVALKMTLQYWLNRNEKRDVFIAFENAFHGDTFGAMAASGIGLFNAQFSNYLIDVERIPLPSPENWKEVKNRFKQLLETAQIAGFIFEPLVLGAAGMQIYSPAYLDELIKMAQAHQVICIADEVMTGFGKTGKLFASQYLKEKPDIFCLSKALTGGVIPFAATTTTQDIFSGFYDTDINKAFFHGHSFMANPAGCAAAIASLDLTLSSQTTKNIHRISLRHQAFIEQLNKIDIIHNVRTLGVILAFQIGQEKGNYYGNLRNKLYDFFIDHGIILRPVGNIVYILPPYCITDEQLDKVYSVILKAIKVIKP